MARAADFAPNVNVKYRILTFSGHLLGSIQQS